MTMHDELNNDALALIRSARPGEAPPTTSRNRVRYALAAKIGAAGVGSAGVGAAITAQASGAATLAASTKALFVSLAIVAAASGIGVWRAIRPQELPAVPAVAAVAPAPTAGPPVPAPTVVDREAAPVIQAIKPAPRRTSRVMRGMPKPQANELLRETSALAIAQEELRAGNPAAALVLLNQYQAQFPSGVLREESEATRVQAMLDAGNRQEACKLAQMFTAHWPRSPHLIRVRSVCDKP